MRSNNAFTSFLLLIVMSISLFFSVGAFAAPPAPPRTVSQAETALMGQELQTILLAVAIQAQASPAARQSTELTLASYAVDTPGLRPIATTGDGRYLVITAGISDTNGRISAGGKILAIPLPALGDAVLTSVFAALGHPDGKLTLTGQFTVPAFKLRCIFVIKGRPVTYNLTATAEIDSGDQLRTLKTQYAKG